MGDAFNIGLSLRQAKRFKASKEEGLVVAVIEFGNNDRAAHVDAEVVHFQLGNLVAEIVGRIQIAVLKVLEGASMELIGARFGDGCYVGDARRIRPD